MRPLLPDQMADADGAALRDGDAEEVGEHDDVDAVGARGQRLGSHHVDEEGDDHL